METAQAADRGLHQTVQVLHLDDVMGEAHPGRLQPLDPAHPRPSLCGLSLGYVVGSVQRVSKKVPTQWEYRCWGPPNPPASNHWQARSTSSESGEDPGLRD